MIVSDIDTTCSSGPPPPPVTDQVLIVTPPSSENGRDGGKLMGGTVGPPGYFLNTKGTCFLCLQSTSSLSSGFYSGAGKVGDEGSRWSDDDCEEEEEECTKITVRKNWQLNFEEDDEGGPGGGVGVNEGFHHWNIFRYFDITPRSIAKSFLEGTGACSGGSSEISQGEELEPEPLPPGAGGNEEEPDDFSVLICQDCSVVARRMSRLCTELELIQRRLDRCADSVQEIIEKSDSDPGRLEEFRRQHNGGGPRGGDDQDKKKAGAEAEGIFQGELVNLLRRELKEKCITRTKSGGLPKKAKPSSRVVLGDIPEVSTAKTLSIDTTTTKKDDDVDEDDDDEPLQIGHNMAVNPSGVITYKQNHESYSVQDLTTEWLNSSVPEMEQEISIPIASCGEDSLNSSELLFEQPIPSLPPLIDTDVDHSFMDSSSPSPSTPIPSQAPAPPILLFSSSTLPPPPPPVNLPRKPPKKQKKKKKPVPPGGNKDPISRAITSTLNSSTCPVDFYFHKKQDNRHLCPFCADTSPTLTNLRFHVIRAHPEQLFANSKFPNSTPQDFRGHCELMLVTVTKEAETGTRNPSGTKVIVKCKFCEEDDSKVYHDKRAFQCHLILNHYHMLTQRLLEIQNGIIPGCAVAPFHVSQDSPFFTQNNKSSSSSTSSSTTSDNPKKKRSSTTMDTGDTYNSPKKRKDSSPKPVESPKQKSIFICEHCGKSLSSSTSKWRHKQQYCEVLRSRGEIPPPGGGGPKITTPSKKITIAKSPLVIIDESRISSSSGLDTDSNFSAQDDLCSSMTTASSSNCSSTVYLISSSSPTGHHHHDMLDPTTCKNDSLIINDGKAGLELLLKEANDMILKEEETVGGEAEVEYDQFVNEFQEYYDEDEVNDALLTMMMENVPGGNGGIDGGDDEDPLM